MVSDSKTKALITLSPKVSFSTKMNSTKVQNPRRYGGAHSA